VGVEERRRECRIYQHAKNTGAEAPSHNSVQQVILTANPSKGSKKRKGRLVGCTIRPKSTGAITVNHAVMVRHSKGLAASLAVPYYFQVIPCCCPPAATTHCCQ